MAITTQSIKKLYGLSAGLCNICKTRLFENDVHIGEMAHVIAKSASGPRGLEALKERDSYENLILLCTNHHTEVDQNSSRYTVIELHRIKNEHEAYVASSLERPNNRNGDIFSLNIIIKWCPLTRLASYLSYLPAEFNIEFFSLSDVVRCFHIDNSHCLPFSDVNLDTHFNKLMHDHSELASFLSGNHNGISIFISNDRNPNMAIFNGHSFSYEEVAYLRGKVESLQFNFINSYTAFIRFIRASYPEVNLDSYSA